MNLPTFDQISSYKSILVAGMGVLCDLPIYLLPVLSGTTTISEALETYATAASLTPRHPAFRILLS